MQGRQGSRNDCRRIGRLQRLFSRAIAMSLPLILCSTVALGNPQASQVSGKVVDPEGAPVAAAHVKVLASDGTALRETTSDQRGEFHLGELSPGKYILTAEVSAFAPISLTLVVGNGQPSEIDLQFRQFASMRQAITVVGASAPSTLTPDPSEHVIVHDQVLDANPGRPGAPVSLPGLPIETASGGIKAPQYFSPGVAGDHGEPIGQFYQIGDFLYPNNLPANAHGNGYADPNILIPNGVASVEADGGAFNVREGNHAVNRGVSYGLRDRILPLTQFTADQHD